jgi:hypothetical protein
MSTPLFLRVSRDEYERVAGLSRVGRLVLGVLVWRRSERMTTRTIARKIRLYDHTRPREDEVRAALSELEHAGLIRAEWEMIDGAQELRRVAVNVEVEDLGCGQEIPGVNHG